MNGRTETLTDKQRDRQSGVQMHKSQMCRWTDGFIDRLKEEQTERCTDGL
jgi:hypothetical protein